MNIKKKKEKNVYETKLFRTIEEQICLLVIGIILSVGLTPVANHIIENTEWSNFTIENIADRYVEGQERIKKENEEKRIKHEQEKLEKENKK